MTVKTLSTTCMLDCPDACALEATVERLEDGTDRLRSLAAGDDHPTTGGFICSKVARFDRRLDSELRLRQPLRRSGAKGDGEFVEISWDDALAEIAGRLGEIASRWGGEAVLPYHYGGSNGVLSDGLVDQAFFARLGASRLAKTICAVPTSEVASAMYGKMPGVAYEDFVEARAILIWGANPKASGIHLVPFLRQARERGAFVAVVDPQRNFSASEIDLHLPVYPGADLPLALGLIHEWQRRGELDRSFLDLAAVGLEPLLAAAQEWTPERAAAAARVPLEDLLTLARTFAEASPAVVRCGWGLERNANGGQAVAAVLAIPALLGKFGVRGGGYTMSNSGAVRRAAGAPRGPRWNTRAINMTRLSEALAGEASALALAPRPGRLEPPVKALFVYNCNPVATVPDQNGILRGLARQDLFTVVSEQVMTDTARWADLVLPATTFLEHRDLRVGYGSYVVGAAQPVVEARGSSRPNEQLFGALGRAMGFDDEIFHLDSETLMRRVTGAIELWDGRPLDTDRLLAGGVQRQGFPVDGPVQLETVVPPTADGKVRLTPSVLGEAPYRWQPVESSFPLALITPASSRLLNSTFGEHAVDRLTVTLHPEDATARGLAAGDAVRVFNDLGEVHCHLRVSSQLRPGVAQIPKGAWRRSSLNGATGTALCPTHVNVVGGGACFNDARVEVTKL